VAAHTIMTEVLAAWGAAQPEQLEVAIESFFDYFRHSLRTYPDTLPALRALRDRGLPIAVLTDVPYGMPRRFIEADLTRAGLLPYVDYYLTSLDVGFRKPNPRGLLQIAKHFHLTPADFIAVGNEPKDITAAQAAGMSPVLIDRDGTATPAPGVQRIATLAELVGA
ncbi:MAG TPA: HAD family hydrolase, partial [Polyangiales bacterium]|nr:HAD family hydrolase [Polyangiales bacterium]